MNLPRLFVAAFFATTASVAGAANFTVTNPEEFQTALTTAEANGESDSISVSAGTYNLATTLTYMADVNENFSLVINGGDSTAVTLDGGSQLPILRIDTTAVTNDDGVFVEVRNMTFRNGNALGAPADGGALAIVMDDANQPAVFATIVAVTGSEFYDNAADGNGGAVYIRSPAVEGIYLDDLTFDGNDASLSGGAAYVEGRWVGTPIALSNIDFFNNTAQGSGGALYVGGFDVDSPPDGRASSISLYDIAFNNNQSLGVGASDGGGGADLGASGLISITLTGFIDNDARSGGGLRIRPNFADITMVNSGFTGNTASEDGGAIWASNTFLTFFTLTNNTIYANTATNRGGGAFLEFNGGLSTADFYNNVIYANVAVQGDGDDLYVNNNSPEDQPGTVNVFNSVVTDIFVTPGPLTQGDNIDQDPLLADYSARPNPDPRLLSGSPAIDTGLNTAPSAPTTDFEFDARPFDGDGDTVATIDIGMDEFTGAIAQNVDLRVTKVADANPVVEGSDVTYTVTVTNLGPGDASGVFMVDTLPGLLSYISATPSQGSCAEAAGVVTCDIGAIEVGLRATVTIVAGTPDVPDTTVVTNSATVSGAEPDPNEANNSVTLDTTIVPAGVVLADVSVTKEYNPTFDLNLDYAVTVTNNGPNDATGVVLTDTLPALVDFVSADPTVGTCVHDAGVITCDIGALANGESAEIAISTLPPIVETDTEVTNTVTVAATEEDPTPGNNTASVTTTIGPPIVDLSVSISSTPAEPLVNEPITFDIGVINGGFLINSPATGVVLTIELPAGLTLVSVTPDQGTCDVGDGTITCAIGDLPGDASTFVEVVLTAPGEAGAIVLSATVSSDTTDADSDNNADSSSVTVIDVIDIVVEGTSEGTGAFGLLELLVLIGAAALVANLRRSTGHVATLALIALLPLAALFSADDARAQGDWYMGAAIGQADIDYSAADLTNDLDSLGWTIDGATVDNDGTAWKIYGGWSFSDYVAVELGWVDLGKVDTRYSATILPDEIDAILVDTFSVHPLTGDGITAAAVLKWPVGDSFSVYAKAGMFAWNSDVDVRVVQGGTGQVVGDDDGTDAMYGVGMEWKFSAQWSLTAEWERYRLNEWLDVPTVGVRFTF